MKLRITLISLLTLFSIYSLRAQCSGAQFEEQDGIVVIEGESLSINSSWRKESSKSGYTGSGYLIWRGTQYFGSPGNGLIQTTIRINNPGKYRFAWRNTIGIIASSNASTEHNDSWLKFPNASNFYGELSNGGRVYPGGSGQSPTAEGSTSGGWFKVYVNKLNWTWDTNTSDFDAHPIFVEFNSPGVYTLQISARSSGHIIDRMILHRVGSTSFSAATNTSLSQTFCDGSSTPPPPPPPPPPGENDPPTVSITSPSNGASFSVGSNVTVNLNSSDPNGNISTHEIFVNGTKVDTDGSSYSPHVISNIAQGSYAIRAKVTDSNGASAESTVNITVGGGGTPPPPPPPPPPSGENEAPTVVITNPAEGENFSAGSTVTVGVSANDSDGSITTHQVYVNNVLVDTDGSNYTPHNITNISAGSYAIKVTVTDNDGATDSSTVNITVGSSNPPPPPPPPPPSGENAAPTVSITSPNDGQNFNVGSTVSVNVSANDSDGTVTKYQVYVNNTLVDTDGENFTPHAITNIAQGNYAIKVTVTDNEGATASSTVNITVGSSNPPPPPPPPPSNGITLTRMNPTTNISNGPLYDGNTFDLEFNFNLRANVSNSNAQSVYFQLSGATSWNQIENVFPYALFGDNSGNYNPGNWNSGSHTLTVESFSGTNGSGTLLQSRTFSFNVSGNNDGKSAIAYPNPVKQGKVNVKLPESITGVAGYAIISPSGIEIERGSIDASKMGDTKLLQIDSANMKNDGVYYLVIQANYDVFTVPIIKQ